MRSSTENEICEIYLKRKETFHVFRNPLTLLKSKKYSSYYEANFLPNSNMNINLLFWESSKDSEKCENALGNYKFLSDLVHMSVHVILGIESLDILRLQ